MKLKLILLSFLISLGFAVAPQAALANSFPTVAELAQANGGQSLKSTLANYNGNVMVAKLYQNNTVIITSRQQQDLAKVFDIRGLKVYATSDVSLAQATELVGKLLN
ncbi:hypothetical protein CJP74_00850 [Psittacicella melopsittaci]|uniref:Uncharacterized protein n=1 Tax=Psittacicella melopsittaci TaxID=2028576 RepID=A0A3A1Y9E4_9GAMM|nr:hypothetical protein [Psittacicella melopsittaci]RIY33818.1 hypothetical protein CJP74_00850 [Psittacicella melopsittaci]